MLIPKATSCNACKGGQRHSVRRHREKAGRRRTREAGARHRRPRKPGRDVQSASLRERRRGSAAQGISWGRLIRCLPGASVLQGELHPPPPGGPGAGSGPIRSGTHAMRWEGPSGEPECRGGWTIARRGGPMHPDIIRAVAAQQIGELAGHSTQDTAEARGEGRREAQAEDTRQRCPTARRHSGPRLHQRHLPGRGPARRGHVPPGSLRGRRRNGRCRIRSASHGGRTGHGSAPRTQPERGAVVTGPPAQAPSPRRGPRGTAPPCRRNRVVERTDPRLPGPPSRAPAQAVPRASEGSPRRDGFPALSAVGTPAGEG